MSARNGLVDRMAVDLESGTGYRPRFSSDLDQPWGFDGVMLPRFSQEAMHSTYAIKIPSVLKQKRGQLCGECKGEGSIGDHLCGTCFGTKKCLYYDGRQLTCVLATLAVLTPLLWGVKSQPNGVGNTGVQLFSFGIQHACTVSPKLNVRLERPLVAQLRLIGSQEFPHVKRVMYQVLRWMYPFAPIEESEIVAEVCDDTLEFKIGAKARLRANLAGSVNLGPRRRFSLRRTDWRGPVCRW